MSIPNTRVMTRRPTHPGEMLREDFLPDYGLSVAGLAEAAGVSRQSVNELLRGRRAVSPEMAFRLSRLFGNTPEFWMNAQRAVDLWEAMQALKGEVGRIKPLRVAAPLSPTAFSQYAGRYRSDELDAEWTIVADGGKLFVRDAPGEDPPPRPIFRDGVDGVGTVHFERDATGIVTGLTATTYDIKELRFVREMV